MWDRVPDGVVAAATDLLPWVGIGGINLPTKSLLACPSGQSEQDFLVLFLFPMLVGDSSFQASPEKKILYIYMYILSLGETYTYIYIYI